MTVSNLGAVLTARGTHRSLLVVNANMTSTADLSVKGVLVPAPGTNVTVCARTGGSAPPRLTASLPSSHRFPPDSILLVEHTAWGVDDRGGGRIGS